MEMTIFNWRATALITGYIAISGALAGCPSGEPAATTASNVDGAPRSVANEGPSIAGSPAPAVRVGETYSFRPSVSNPDDSNLVFEISNKPAWATFDRTTGELSGSPSAGAVGEYQGIVITVSDGAMSAALQPFSVSVVQSALGSITVNWQPPVLNDDGTPLRDLSGYRIYYGNRSDSYETVIDIDNVGLTSYVIENLVPGTYFLVATSYNRQGVESAYSNEIATVVN